MDEFHEDESFKKLNEREIASWLEVFEILLVQMRSLNICFIWILVGYY